MTKIGFTGTRKGMTQKQKESLDTLLGEFPYQSEFHHGDCIGADAEAHDIAALMHYLIWIHPPKNSSQQAFKPGPHFGPPEEYLVRNKRIVRATDLLVACPGETQMHTRSGTWSTVRYATLLGKSVKIVFPDGRIG